MGRCAVRRAPGLPALTLAAREIAAETGLALKSHPVARLVAT